MGGIVVGMDGSNGSAQALKWALEEGRRLLADAVTKAGGGEDVRQEVLIGEGHGPAKALLDAASGADMLVVGSRGRGGFQGLLLGSVSQQVLHHAKCPVVVIPTA